MGVFPTTAEGHLIEEFGMCTTPLLEPLPALRAACVKKQLSLHALTAAVTARHSKAVFAQVQSKTDEVQMGFNWALSADPIAHPGSPRAATHPRAGWTARSFMARRTTTSRATTPTPTTSTSSSSRRSTATCPTATSTRPTRRAPLPAGGGGEPLHHWMARLPLRPGTNITTRCVGEQLPKGKMEGEPLLRCGDGGEGHRGISKHLAR